MKTIVRFTVFQFIIALTSTSLALAQWTSNPPSLYTTTDNIGIGITNPTFLLDVNGGDINLTNDANFIRIAGEEALYFDGSNLMVGWM